MDKLQKIYESSLLQKLGFNHTWPKDLRYGNHNIGSLRIPNLYLEQFLHQLDILLRMLHNNATKTLMNNVINTYHLQYGGEKDPLQYPEKCTYTDSAWLQELRNAMVTFNVQLHRPNKMTFPPNRVNDKNLMDTIKLHITNKEDIKRINTCRQYVKAMNLSDITNALGTHIDKIYLEKQKHESSLQWSHLKNPPQKTWEAWKKSIKKTFCQQTEELRLKENMKMGAWYKKPSQLQKKWKYVYAASTSTVYNMETIPVQANFLTLTKRNRYEIMDIDMEYTDNIPNDIQPISEISNTTFDFNPNHSFHTPPKKIIRTWQEYIQTLPHYEQIMLKYTIIQKPILLQQTFEQQEEIIICSDGALKE